MVSPDYVKQLQLEKQLKCWTVMSYDRKSVLNENDSTEVELQDSIDRLQSALRAIMSEMVFVRLRPNTKAERGKGGNANSETYDLVVKINNSPTAQQHNLTGPTWNDYQALNNKYLEVQIERLRLELSDNKESITDQLIKALASNPRLVGSIAGAIERIAGGPAIAAPPQTYQVQNTLQQNNDVTTAAQRLQELIPDKPVGEILTKMATFLEANQGQIPQILAIISPD